MPTRDARYLLHFQTISRTGLLPKGCHGWVLLEYPPTHPDGRTTLHHSTVHQRVAHPRILNRPLHHYIQPRHGDKICHHWHTKHRCESGSRCPHVHTASVGPLALCANFHRGRTCTKGPTCDYHHGLTISDPTGRDHSTPHNAYRVTPDTLPMLLTDNPYPPPLDQDDHARSPTRRALWAPVPTQSVYDASWGNMTAEAYGYHQGPTWTAVQRPTRLSPIGHQLEGLITSLTSLNNIQPEVANHLLERHIRPMIDALPNLTWGYNPNRLPLVQSRDNAGHVVWEPCAPSLRPPVEDVRRDLRDTADHANRRYGRVHDDLQQTIRTMRPRWQPPALPRNDANQTDNLTEL